MTDIEKTIRARVDAFVVEISDLVRQAAFDRLSDALGGTSVSGGRGRRDAEKRLLQRDKGQKRAPAEMARLLKAITQAVHETPGIRADQLAQQLGIATRDTSLPIKKLLAEKAITKKGQKRATQYFAGKAR